LQTKKLVNAETIGVEMSEIKSIDIDTYEDMKLAKVLAEKEFKIK